MSVSGTQSKGIVLAAGTAVNSAAANIAVANTWYQVIASTAAPIYIIATVVTIGNATADATINVGTGGAGSEVAVMVDWARASSTSGGNEYRSLRFPIRVPTGTRVAVRCSQNASPANIAVVYVNESAVV